MAQLAAQWHSKIKLVKLVAPSYACRWTTDSAGNEYLVVELVQLGSLDGVLRAVGQQLHTHNRLAMCEQICSAMLEVAQAGIVHGDLACRNILVKSLDPIHVKVSG